MESELITSSSTTVPSPPFDWIHPNLKLLSHSSSVLLHKCKRKYELYKLMTKMVGKFGEEDGEHLDFGAIVGIGCQEFLVSGGSKNLAWMKMLLEWKTLLDDDRGTPAKKTFWHALNAVAQFETMFKQRFARYELVYFNGKPAVELGFSIDCGDGFYYRGKMDILLRHRDSGEFLPLEMKTTKFSNINEASYKHSSQALGYSLVLDAIAASLGAEVKNSIKVNYPIYSTYKLDWVEMEFTKNKTSRALWIKNILLDKQIIIDHALDGYFPMYGENCFDFFRPCEYFGICEMGNKILLAGEEGKTKVDREEDYPFKFNLMELVEAQLKLQEQQ